MPDISLWFLKKQLSFPSFTDSHLLALVLFLKMTGKRHWEDIYLTGQKFLLLGCLTSFGGLDDRQPHNWQQKYAEDPLTGP